MKYILKMSSFEYGQESFEYDSLEERDAGLQRILKKARELNDGISRSFQFVEDQGEND